LRVSIGTCARSCASASARNSANPIF
jgi:hypothetical protein